MIKLLEQTKRLKTDTRKGKKRKAEEEIEG